MEFILVSTFNHFLEQFFLVFFLPFELQSLTSSLLSPFSRKAILIHLDIDLCEYEQTLMILRP